MRPDSCSTVATVYQRVRTVLGQPRAREQLLVALLVPALAYILPRALRIDEDAVDFRLLWLSGKMWLEGIDPYSPMFDVFYRQELSLPVPVQHFWVYPPHWYPITTTLASLPLPNALMAWKYLNFALLCGATTLVASAVFRALGGRYLTVLVVGLLTVFCMFSTVTALGLGQTSMLVYFGIALLLYGCAFDRPVAIVAGLFILTLKPNVGISFLVAAALIGRWRCVVVALVLAALVSTFGDVPLLQQLQGFLANLRRYGNAAILVNQPPDLTGVVHLADYFFDRTLSSMALVGASIAVAALICRGGRQTPQQDVLRLVACTGAVLVLVPLHSYDLVLFGILAMTAAAATTHPARWLLFAGVVLAERAGNLGRLPGLHHPETLHFQGSLLESVAVVVAGAGAIWLLFDARQAVVERERSSAVGATGV